jgi:hypothetical protein
MGQAHSFELFLFFFTSLFLKKKTSQNLAINVEARRLGVWFFRLKIKTPQNIIKININYLTTQNDLIK